MTTSNANHVTGQVDAYVAGGLGEADRRAVETHAAGCPACAAALAAARSADAELTRLFAAGRPAGDFEDRLLARLRPGLGWRAGPPRWAKPILHPLVRRVATGVAAALVVGTVGYGMNRAIEQQRERAAATGFRQEHRGPSAVARDARSADAAASSEFAETEVDRKGRYADGFADPADTRWNRDGDGGGGGGGGGAGDRRGYRGGAGGYGLNTPDEIRQQTRDLLLGRDGASPARAKGTAAADDGTRADTVLGLKLRTPDGGAASPKTEQARGEQAAEKLAQLSDAQAASPQQPGGVPQAKNPPAGWQEQEGTEGKGGAPAWYSDSARAGRDEASDYFTPPPPGSDLSGKQAGKRPAAGPVAGNKIEAGGAAEGGGVGGRGGEGAFAKGRSGGGPGGGPGGVGSGGGGAGMFGGNVGGAVPAGPAGGSGPLGSVVAAGVDKPQEPNFTNGPEFSLQGTTEGGKPGGGVAAGDGIVPAGGVATNGGTLAFGRGADETSVRAKSDAGERKLLEAPKVQGGTSFKPADALAGESVEGLAQGLKVVGDGEKRDGKAMAGKPADGPADPAKPGEAVRGLGRGDEAAKAAAAGPAAAPAPPAGEGAGAGARTSGGAAAAAAAADPVAQQQLQRQAAQQARKVIRNGSLNFEVDSFDSAMLQVGKIAGEEGGFVATTDSEKLPNGKVRGSVTVRCPPERLDTLVLKLRGLGDLKNQRIVAQDVTKKYVDTESQLRAAKAMEERLLAIIKAGGAVKDLLEAEKQLGVWREKREVLEGEMRYLDAQVALSTLVVELLERDVRTPTSAAETETVSAGIETDDVEKVRAEALAAVEQAKGRVVDSDLKKLEGGQLSATITADVAPDAAGPVIDRLKQLGKVARLDVSRKTTTTGGVGPIAPGLRVERKETRFQVNLYNLANIAPRQATSVNLAAADVEATYRSILDQVKAAGGRVVASQLNRPKADQTVGTVSFEVPADKADVLLGAIRGGGGVEVMRMEVTTNPDAQNTTEAKRGFVAQVYSLAHVPAREQTTLQVAARDVPAAFAKLLEAARAAGGRVLTSQLNEQDASNVSGSLDFEVPRDKWAGVDAALREAGLLVTRNVTRSPDAEGTVDSKVRLSLSLVDEVRLAARETVAARVAARNVPEAFAALAAAAREAGARVVGSNLNVTDRTNPNGSLSFAVPRENAGRVEAALREAGLLVSRAVNRVPDGATSVEAKVGFAVEVFDERGLVARESHAMAVVAPKVSDRYAKLLEDLRLLDAQVTRSQLSVQNKNDVTGELDFVVRRDDRPTIEKALADGADVFNRTVARSQDVQNTVDTKVRFSVILKDADQQPARQNYTLAAETADVEKAVGDVEAAAVAAGGRKLDSTRTSDRGEDVARVVVDVPLARAGDVVNAVRSQGRVTVTQTGRNDAVPEGTLSRARVEVTFGSPGTVRAEQGFGDTIRAGLSTALTGLAISLRYIIVGLLVVVPWLLILWAVVRLIRRGRRRAAADASVPPTTPNVPGPGAGPTPTPA